MFSKAEGPTAISTALRQRTLFCLASSFYQWIWDYEVDRNLTGFIILQCSFVNSSHQNYHSLSCQQILPGFPHTDNLPLSPCCFRFGGLFVVNSTSKIGTIVSTKITARFRGVSRLFLFLMTMFVQIKKTYKATL